MRDVMNRSIYIIFMKAPMDHLQEQHFPFLHFQLLLLGRLILIMTEILTFLSEQE